MNTPTSKLEVLDTLKYQLKRRRESVRLAGITYSDDADKVYIGEDIGKLDVVIRIIHDMDWFS